MVKDVAHAADEVLSASRSAYFANLWNDAGADGRCVLGAVLRITDALKALMALKKGT